MSARFWHKAAPQEFSFLASAQMFGFGTKIGQKVDDDGDDGAEQISQPYSPESHLTLTNTPWTPDDIDSKYRAGKM